MGSASNFQVTHILCNDVTWSKFYDAQGWKYQRLESYLQFRGYSKPTVIIHDEDMIGSSLTEEEMELQSNIECLAELGHVHLEYAHIEDSLVGEGEDLVIDKFFPSGV